MVYIDGTIALSLACSRGQRLLNLIKRPDGSARYEEITVSSDPFDGNFWFLSLRSDVFQDVAEATSHAKTSLSWLSDEGVQEVTILEPDRSKPSY